MSALPDPAELAPSRDPAAYGARPLLSRGFWAMMILAALCLAAGAALVVLGPRVFSARPAAPAATNPAPALAAAPVPMAPPLTAALPAAPAGAVAPDRVVALEGRVQALEANEARSLDAAAAALAAASLSQAAAQPRPFAAEVAGLERLMPGSADAQALAPLAAQGAPTRPALAASLSDLAAQASTAAKAPGRGAGYMAQLAYAISRVVSVRRVDPQASGPDGLLARAQRRADEGDLEGAVVIVDSLPGAARTPLAPWRAEAARRIAIDQHIGALSARAAADLAAAQIAGQSASRASGAGSAA